MPADERRRVIIEATKPLLAEFGDKVTTRQIAEAAGIAEGTIFRVFDNKDEIFEAVLQDFTDPSRIHDMIEATGGQATLADQVASIIERVQADMSAISRLMPFLHQRRMRHDGARFHEHERPSHAPLIEAMAQVLEPFADEMTITPAQAAWLIETITLSVSMPHAATPPFASPAELAHVLLTGIQKTKE